MHKKNERAQNPLFFAEPGRGKCRLGDLEKKLTEDARNDTPHSVCGYSRQPQHERWLMKRRYAASVWDDEMGRVGWGGAEREGGNPGERGEKRERGSNYEQQQLPAGRASTVWNYLEKERNEMSIRAGGGC